MISTITRLEDGTITLHITVPKSEVKKTEDEVIEEFVKNAKIPGFRKGKAPKKIVETNVSKANIREEVLRHLLPKFYIQAVQEHKIRPMMDPRIHVKGDLKEGEDWEFEASTAEAPEVNLGTYKEAIKQVTAKSKIIVPGKPASPNASQGGEPEQVKFDDIVKVLLDTVTLKIPAPLLDRETDRLLAQSLDEIKKLGLSLDQYLSSTGKTAEGLRLEYQKRAENDLKLELILQKVAESEKITVDDAEISSTIAKAKTPEEKKGLEANRYLLASIIRQQKTLDFLKSL